MSNVVTPSCGFEIMRVSESFLGSYSQKMDIREHLKSTAVV